MLHHDQRVARIAQTLEGVDELVVVPLMQTDGRLVQDIQNAHEGGADLGGKPNALCLAARKRPRLAGEVHIIQSHVDKEAQAGTDLL